MAASTMAGPIIPSRLRCHCRWLSQPKAFASKATAANSGISVETNSPSYCCRKPSPMTAPKLAIAGKQAAQPIAETTLPSAPALSAARVTRLMARSDAGSAAQGLTCDG